MTTSMKPRYLLPVVCTLLAGCGATQYEFDVDRHITKETVAEERPVAQSGVPDLVSSTAELPVLEYEGTTDVFDIVVDNVSVRQVILSLADQAQLDMDIDPRVEGLISLNAYGQTVSQILERIRHQLPVRFEKVGSTLVIMNDELYYRQYSLNFPDLIRSYSASADGSVPTSGSGSVGTSSIATTKGGSGSIWQDLEEAIEQLLISEYNVFTYAEVGPVPFDEQSAQRFDQATQLAARQAERVVEVPFSYTIRDAGLIIVYGSAEQHRLIGEVIGKVSEASRRQVLLQATVVEIVLNNNYQHGIDWSIFNDANTGPKVIQSASGDSGGAFASPSTESLTELASSLEGYLEGLSGFRDTDTNGAASRASAISQALAKATNTLLPSGSASGGFISAQSVIGDVNIAITLLDKFGDTKVVSSPRVSTLNGQGAILKVVEDRVYFLTETTRERDDSGVVTETIEVTAQTVPVGFIVNVYPQIGNDGTIFLSMRPSVSRVIGVALPPAVAGSAAVTTGVPIISVKEIETLMLLNDGQTAVMGGMIEDLQADSTTGVPGANRIPGIGGLFENVKQESRRVEYVIFVSAKIIHNPSIHGDYSDFQDWLPSDETFHRDQTTSFFNNEVQKISRAN